MIKLLNKIRKYYRCEAYLFIIICAAFYLRTFNINWDNGYYFHPDERAYIMVSLPIHWTSTLSGLFSVQSPLNPHFFAYGSFPIYLLKVLSHVFGFINPILAEYGGVHIIGRLISAVFDTSTVFIIYLICSKIFTKKIGVLSACLYAFSVLPIQLSHFFAVDTILTFFMTSTIYSLVLLIDRFNIKNASLTGLFFGLALATKISAVVLTPIVFIALTINFFRKKRKLKKWVLNNIVVLIILVICTGIVFFIAQPYSLIDYKAFSQQTLLQTQMSNNAFIFPYTLQYVGKIPYIYELKNIFMWGQGPIISIVCIMGIIFMTIRLKRRIILILPALFLALYFALFGKFAVGFIRYMLPIYPILSIFGGWFLSEIVLELIPKTYLKRYFFVKFLMLGFILLILVYPISFISIYTKPNTRIQASDWINKNIPQGSKIAVEHWDDSLPVYGMQKYEQLTLPLYDPDTKEKWQSIHSILQQTDYIIIASGRLYIPLQKLTDCKHLPVNRCYPLTAKYYKNLFSGKLGFKKIQEFKSEPTIPFINIGINDLSADENFTVFDHPTIMIFKKK
jgi:4-amino-4-deoxy-L-arabinose transferase-like glycosyltransferase